MWSRTAVKAAGVTPGILEADAKLVGLALSKAILHSLERPPISL